MLERYNPILRLVCIALAGLIVYQLSRLTFKSDVVARSSFEPLPVRVESTNPPAPTETSAQSAPTNSSSSPLRPPRGPGDMAAPAKSNLPKEVQALVDKIKQSQLLGPDIKPPPMALLGIAGKDVFLRAPSGQTGVVREGEELGGVKLIRIGTNRVIVEHEKQQKELTIFSGFGSETLLEKKEKREPLP